MTINVPVMGTKLHPQKDKFYPTSRSGYKSLLLISIKTYTVYIVQNVMHCVFTGNRNSTGQIRVLTLSQNMREINPELSDCGQVQGQSPLIYKA